MAGSSASGRATREQLHQAAWKVAYYFRAYGSYGGNRAAALRALGRRVPGIAREDREQAFDFFCLVYEAVVKAVAEVPRPPRSAKSRYSSFGDIDFAACMARLDDIDSGSTLPQKRDMLTMVIGYHYLR